MLRQNYIHKMRKRAKNWALNHRILFFLSLFIYLFYFIFKLYIIVLVLPNIKMNPPQVYMCSPSWTLLPPPSPYHPSGSSQCTSTKHQVSCIIEFLMDLSYNEFDFIFHIYLLSLQLQRKFLIIKFIHPNWRIFRITKFT